MSKPFTIIAALVLLLAAAAHAYRLYTGAITVTIAGQALPMWASWPAAVIAAILGLMVLVEARK
jgi:lipopolysaccharide export LptBFGC system permease protein LptF